MHVGRLRGKAQRGWTALLAATAAVSHGQAARVDMGMGWPRRSVAQHLQHAKRCIKPQTPQRSSGGSRGDRNSL